MSICGVFFDILVSSVWNHLASKFVKGAQVLLDSVAPANQFHVAAEQATKPISKRSSGHSLYASVWRDLCKRNLFLPLEFWFFLRRNEV